MSIAHTNHSIAVAMIANILTFSTICQAQVQHMDWVGGASSSWSNPLNWNPQLVPDQPDEQARVPIGALSTVVNMDLSPNIDELFIENTAAVLEMNAWTLTTATGFTNGGLVKAYDGTATIQGPLTILGSGSVRLRGYSCSLNLGGPTVVNDGLIVVNQEAAWGSDLNCVGNVSLSGVGSILLNKASSEARLNTTGCTLTQAASHTIRGLGQVHAALENAGLVHADVAGQALELLTNPKGNTGTLKASGGALLDVVGVTVTQGGAGQILADAGTVRLLNGASVIGGTLASTNGGGVLSWDGSNTLRDVTLPSGTWMGVRGYGRQLHLSGSAIANNGQIVVNYENAWDSRLLVDETLELQGSGEIVLNKAGTDAQLATAANVILTQAPGHTMRGLGQIDAAMVNNGSIIADVSGQTLALNPQAPGVTNNGTINVAAGCNMQINNAALFAQSGGRMIVNGTLQVGGGSLQLPGGRLTGSGGISGSVQNDGAALGPGGSIGALSIVGSYLQNTAGRLEIELIGTTPGVEHDRLAVSGAATLAGELCVLPIDGFMPTPGQEFVIVTASVISGQFERQSGPGLYEIISNPTNVTIRCIAPPGDLNCDTAFSLLDIDAFVLALLDPQAFQSTYPDCDMLEADLNNDGRVDAQDIPPFLDLLIGG